MTSISSYINKSTNTVLVQSLYLLVLLFTSISYKLTFKLAYFTLPLASLCFPLLFLLAGLLASCMPISRCLLFITICTCLNYFVVSMISQHSHFVVNDFWVNNFQSQNEIYSLLWVGFHASILTCISLVYLWKRWRRKPSYLVVAASALVANVIDMAFMWPTLWSYVDDHYIASWKLLTIITFKMNILIICLPLGWLLLRNYLANLHEPA